MATDGINSLGSEPRPVAHQRVRHVSGEDSKFHRRTSIHGLSLDFSKLAHYPSVAVPVRDQAENEGLYLYRELLRSELGKRGIGIPCHSMLTPPDRVTANGCMNPGWNVLRRHILRLTTAFDGTPQCKLLCQRCLQADIPSIEKQQFSDMLGELFSAGGSKNKENIVAVFAFSTCLTLRSLDSGETELFDKLLEWTLDFISKVVCPWVRDNGGWDQVLDTSFKGFPKIVAVATIALVVVMSYRLIIQKFSK